MKEQVHKESDIGRIVTHNEGIRPVYTASMDTTNAHVIALADMIFWSDQLREHSKFVEMLLPAEDYPSRRERSVMFKGVFEALFDRAVNTELNEEKISDQSEFFIDQAQKIADFQFTLADEQKSGKIHSLNWPLFLEHIAREADRFARRQKMFMEGRVEFNRDEIIDFWARIMDEHSAFVAHLLDPSEVDLINKALETRRTFINIRENHPLEQGNIDPVTVQINEIIQFKTTALKGVEGAQFKSIITPELADHIRREAVFFDHELRRADMLADIQPAAA